MGLTTPALVGAGAYPIERVKPWAVNNAITAVGAAEELKAAPTRAGSALCITHVTMSAHEADQLIQDVKITLQDEDANVLYGPIQLQVDGSPFKKDWKNPLKLIDNKALYVLGNIGAASCTVYVEGFTGDKPLG